MQRRSLSNNHALPRATWLGLLSLALACGGAATSGGQAGGQGGNAGAGNGSSGGSAGGGSSGSGNAGGGGTGATAGSAGSGVAGSGQAGAGGAGSELTDCGVPSDCVVVPASCCGSCGAATRGDALALNRAWASGYRTSVCEDTGCPACAAPSDPTLVATCSAGQCELIDLQQHPSTACETNEDCVLRTNECCNCGGAQDIEHLIAVNVMSSYASLVCDPNEACDPCVDAPPDRASAYCGSDGHCVAEWALD